MSVYDTMVAGLSGAGLILLGMITPHGSSEYHLNAVQLQAKLQAAADTALSVAGFDWAHVQVDGQRARLTGTPPSAATAREAEQVVMQSSGRGGLLWGGIISVDSAFSNPSDIADITLQLPQSVVMTVATHIDNKRPEPIGRIWSE